MPKLPDQPSGLSAHGSAQYGRADSGDRARGLGLSSLLRRMLRVHVRHLVSHDPAQLSFVLSRRNRAKIDEHLSAWQGKGVKSPFAESHETQTPGVLLRDRGHQPLAELPNVL
jgi:hypothetical protein